MATSIPEKPSLGPNLATSAGYSFVVGVSRSMKGLDALIRELADSDMPVLLTAEAGAGKRATAEHIHHLSKRREQQFRVISSEQIGSAVNGEVGKEFLNAGTVYVEEIADLSLAGQEALLSVLARIEETGEHRKCARLICGTAQDLEAQAREGRFGEDLYYRVSALSLHLPPLRQRKEDIPHLLEFFLHRYAAELHLAVPSIGAETQQIFMEYSWPGNLHELEEAARVLVMMGDENLAMGGLRAMLTKTERQNGKRVSLKEAAKAASREAERELILQVLTRTRWNRRRAAQELQISYKALLYKLKQIGYGELGGAS